MKKHVIVVGTNHAGTSCVNTLLDNYGDTIRVTSYDMNTNISFLGCGMALWIGGVIDKPDGLFYSSPEILTAKGANIRMQHQVISIDPTTKTLIVRNLLTNEEFSDSYDDLVLAMGSWPVRPPIPGLELGNIISVKLFQHAQESIKTLSDPAIKNVVVVGAGYIGIELAEACRQAGKNVTVLDMMDEVVQRYYDTEFTSLLAKKLTDNGIALRLGEAVREFTGVDGKVTAVVTDKNTHPADLVMFSVGFSPQTKWLAPTGIELLKNGAIRVNNNQQTSLPNVYAIGDCASLYNNATASEGYIALASNAVRTGIVAARHIAGHPTPLHGVQGSNAIHIYGLTLTSTGLSEREAKNMGMSVFTKQAVGKQKPDFMPDNHDIHVKLVFEVGSERLIGAQLASEGECSQLIHMFSLAIQERVPLSRLALMDLFFLPHHNRPVDPIMKAMMG